MSRDTVTKSKTKILYAVNKGKFLKKCPGTMPGYLCCNYYVLNVQTNCDYDCQYCILQSYINSGCITVYKNIDKALSETETFLKNHSENFYRIGTGELTDSLSLDRATQMSLILVPFFMKQKNALLELKTKSADIENLLQFNPKNNIVVSWSLNPQDIIDEYEKNAATLQGRLNAAKQCSDKGYRLGFHLDPVILYPGWEEKYHSMLKTVFENVSAKDIVWISVAGFRYTTSLKNTIKKRFPKTKLFLGEFVRCSDGKHRYIRPIRVSAYRKIIGWIKEYGGNIPVYFCMESPVVWKDVFGKLPHEIENLKGIFGKFIQPPKGGGASTIMMGLILSSTVPGVRLLPRLIVSDPVRDQ